MLGLAAFAFVPAVSAGPGDYVFVPYAEAGKRTVGYAFGVAREREGGRETEHALNLGWAPTERWFTALYAGWYGQPGESTSLYSWSWWNHLKLRAQGQGPVEVGVLAILERLRGSDEGTGAITIGPTLQIDTERLQININPLFEKYVGANESAPTELKYQWQVKTLMRPRIELGLQGFGEFGPWNHWLPAAEQAHSLGPAVFFRQPMGGQSALKLDAALLVGVGAGSPRNSFRMRLQQEF
jgi:hypothetical protein